MPKLITINGYAIFIWLSENGEPIHVHVAKKRPTENSTKLWLLSTGQFELAHNRGRIPEKELKAIINKLKAEVKLVESSWFSYHGYIKYIDR